MFSKRDYLSALAKLGFVKDSASRTDGSHIRFYHCKYKNIYAGIDDHKNTTEMKKSIHLELIKAFVLVVYLDCKKQNGTIDFDLVKEKLSGLDTTMAKSIMQRLKKINTNERDFLKGLLTKKLLSEISKIDNSLNDGVIEDYIIN